jgi:hypothetical protein
MMNQTQAPVAAIHMRLADNNTRRWNPLSVALKRTSYADESRLLVAHAPALL